MGEALHTRDHRARGLTVDVEQLGGTAEKGARLVQRATVSLRCQVHGRPEATAVFDRPHNVTTPWRSGVKPPIERPTPWRPPLQTGAAVPMMKSKRD